MDIQDLFKLKIEFNDVDAAAKIGTQKFHAYLKAKGWIYKGEQVTSLVSISRSSGGWDKKEFKCHTYYPNKKDYVPCGKKLIGRVVQIPIDKDIKNEQLNFLFAIQNIAFIEQRSPLAVYWDIEHS